MTSGHARRNVVLVLLGVAALMLKHAYAGGLPGAVHAWGGNVSASFAVYFLAAIAVSRLGLGRFAAATSALLVVEAFEITNGFGVMSNVNDPVDLLANAVGVGIALAIDVATARPAGPHDEAARPATGAAVE